MDTLLIFAVSSIIILFGFLAEWLFEKTNVPDVLWLLFVGIGLKYLLKIDPASLADVSSVFATFALIFILFQGILNFTIKKLALGFVEGTKLSSFSFIFSVITCGIAMHFAGWGFIEGMLLGAMLSDSAQTVIVPLVKKISIGQHAALGLIFESAITDVFTIVGSLTLISIIVIGSVSLANLLGTLFMFIVLSVIIGCAGGILWIFAQYHIEKFTKSSIPSISALLIVYCVSEYFKANGVLACLTFGIIIGNSKKLFADMEHPVTHDAKFFYSELVFFLKTFFFVYMGIVMQIENHTLMIIGFLVSFLLVIVRPLVIAACNFRMSSKDLTYLEIINPKGLAAAVLAQLPAVYHLGHAEQYSTIVMTVIFSSIVFTSLFVFLTERTGFRGLSGIFRLRGE